MTIFPVYKFLKAVSGDYVHAGSSETFIDNDLHLIDEIELYRICDQDMKDQIFAGTIEFYESVSGTDDGLNIELFTDPVEAFDRLCESAFGTPFRGVGDRTISEIKQFSSKDSQRAIEESFPTVMETVSGVPTLRTSTTRVIEFDSPIATVVAVNPHRSKVIINPSGTGVGKGFTLDFLNNGANIKNKWLDFEGANIGSFDTPGLLPLESILQSMVFTNRDNNINIDIQIWTGFLNALVLRKTFPLRNCRYFYSASVLNENVVVPAGSPVRVFAKDPGIGGASPAKCVVELHWVSTAQSLVSVTIPSDPPP